MSEAMRQQLVSSGISASKIVVLHNAILLDDYRGGYSGAGLRPEYGIREDEKVIAIIGRLSAEKGHDVFIDMASRICEKLHNVQFLIVGDGPMLAQCKRRVAELKLQDHVKFTGYRDDMNDIYASIDILAITSFTEGLPNVLLEAFAHAKPVVATSVGGIPEVVSHGESGFLVRAGDTDELVRHMMKLVEEPGLASQMGMNGRRTIHERFSFTSRTRELEKVYERMSTGTAEVIVAD
jgi:glycosyltransferase involved in cell wall biosynthesis